MNTIINSSEKTVQIKFRTDEEIESLIGKCHLKKINEKGDPKLSQQEVVENLIKKGLEAEGFQSVA